MSSLTIYTKGYVKDEQGPAGIGGVVCDQDGEVVLTISEAIGNATKDYADYFAAVRTLQTLSEHLAGKKIPSNLTFFSENNTLIDHLSANATIKDVSLIGHFIEIYNLRVEHFPQLEPKLVTAGDNQSARELAEAALN